ncbi:MAG: hypothetical protein CL678_11500 [Bdellovibrionaceae bacterium]|nr:hypothetical protein [Pseudobdellovibrionaceae bacterium]|tara:strand:- start:726 stop:1253 length:528 start_codon:yes stop_codon:yes gene_type:complete
MSSDSIDHLLNQIYQSLEKLVKLHRQLFENVCAEENHLVSADVKAIQNNLSEKEAILSAIDSAEHLRRATLQRICEILSISESSLTLSRLIGFLKNDSEAFAQKLKSTQEVLSILAKRIKEQNNKNKGLVDQSLLTISQMKKNIMGSKDQAHSIYGKDGQSHIDSSQGRLIQKEI